MNTKESISDDEASLLKLRDSMSEQQRNDMAEIIGNELKRREALRSNVSMKSKVSSSAMSGRLGMDDLKDVYQSADKNIQELRVKALESKVRDAKREASRFGVAPKRRASETQINSLFAGISGKISVIIIGAAILGFAGLKTIKNTSTQTTKVAKAADSSKARASLETPKTEEPFKELEQKIEPVEEKKIAADLTVKIPTTESERAVLMQLDQRRVELERRRVVLDQKEKELVAQAKLVSEKITELKSLTNKLAAMRSEKDSKYTARLDQLAAVYGAMAPNEASGLIAKLDEEVALGLLERMPEKRMAQILGVMEPSRAIELTKLLTDRKGL